MSSNPIVLCFVVVKLGTFLSEVAEKKRMEETPTANRNSSGTTNVVDKSTKRKNTTAGISWASLSFSSRQIEKSI